MNIDEKRKSLQHMLFHLLKGISKGIPIIGDIVDEVIFEQFEERLKGTVDHLDEPNIEHLLTVLPSVNHLKCLEEKLTQLNDEQRIKLTNQYITLNGTVTNSFELIEDKLQDIEYDTEKIPRLIELIEDSRSASQHVSEQVIQLVERRRQDWINRISRNQRSLLDSIPTAHTALSELWNITQLLIPECSYKEFRFRLHELEWLGLIDRSRDNEEWHYYRLVEVGYFK